MVAKQYYVSIVWANSIPDRKYICMVNSRALLYSSVLTSAQATGVDMADDHDVMMSRWAHLQSCLFPWMREEIEPLTSSLERLIIVLDTIGLEAYVPGPPCFGRGRKPDDRRALARTFVAKALLGLPTTSALVERLKLDKSLRRICGWETKKQVPSESTFSRAFAEFAETKLPAQLHEAQVKRSLGQRVVGCIARDATEIEAREKPAQKGEETPPPSPSAGAPAAQQEASTPAPRKRGRPKKGEERPKEPTRLEQQPTQTLDEMLADIPTFRPPATLALKRTARATRRRGLATSFISTLPTAKSL